MLTDLIVSHARKTGRQAGLIWAYIREVAHRRATFTADDLCPPLRRSQAAANLVFLSHAGELRVVRPGVPGRHNHQAATYAAASL